LLSVTVLADEKPFEGFRFCFDPGHGEYPSDKPYETRINIWVGEFIKEYLEEMGAEVLLTHTDSMNNLSLYERDQMANSFDADFFQSIHHNAIGQSNSKTNYTLVLYSKYNSGHFKDDNILMCEIQSPMIYQSLYTTSHLVYSDYDLVGFNYGVLKSIIMPGVLSEASFWDCVPEIMRLNSIRYLQVQAKTIRNAFCKFYEFPVPHSTTLYGQVTDTEGNPVENAKVYVSDGVDTLLYETDKENIGITAEDNSWWVGYVGNLYEVKNGFYFFEDLPSGKEYSIWTVREGYVGSSDTVALDDTVMTKKDMPMISLVPPTAELTYPDPEDLENLPVKKRFAVLFDKAMDTEIMEQAVSFVPDSPVRLRWFQEDKELFIYHDPFEEDTDYQLIIDGAVAVDKAGVKMDLDGDGVTGDSLIIHFHTEGGGTPVSEQEKMISQMDFNIAPNPVIENTFFFLIIPQKAIGQPGTINIYNCIGQKMKKSIEFTGENREMKMEFSCRDDSGKTFSSGIYFVEFKIGTQKVYRKMTVIK